MFKVVPDQLRISDGWVRCGQCDEVFDANAHLQTGLPPGENDVAGTDDAWFEPDPSPTLQPPVPETVQAVMTEPPDAGDSPAQALPPVTDDEALPEESFKIPNDWPVAEATFSDPFLEKSPQELSQFIGTPSVGVYAEPLSDDLEPALSAVTIDDVAEPRYQQLQVDAAALEARDQFSFSTQRPQAPSRSRPWIRKLQFAAVAMLGGGLILQFLVQERDRIAASAPAAVPVLESLCGTLACKLSPLRQIESIAIDSSSFTKVKGDVYRLNFTLKNNAPTGIATPALELTLTDSQDQAVLRRVLAATEVKAGLSVLASGGELSASVPLSVKLPGGSSERIAGYRLLAFYPE